MLKTYLLQEWRYNNHPKYLKYFEEWYSNLTTIQIAAYTKYMNYNYENKTIS